MAKLRSIAALVVLCLAFIWGGVSLADTMYIAYCPAWSVSCTGILIINEGVACSIKSGWVRNCTSYSPDDCPINVSYLCEGEDANGAYCRAPKNGCN
jgi:hypothetical protein